MRMLKTNGPFRTEVREVSLSGRIAWCVRLDRIGNEEEWTTVALFELSELWCLLPALKAALREACLVETSGKG